MKIKQISLDELHLWARLMPTKSAFQAKVAKEVLGVPPTQDSSEAMEGLVLTKPITNEFLFKLLGAYVDYAWENGVEVELGEIKGQIPGFIDAVTNSES